MSAPGEVRSLEDLEVLFVVADLGPETAPEAFARLEVRLPSLRGRKFYGAFHRGVYRASVVRREGDDPAALGLEAARLPGGRYARAVIRDWPSRTAEIAPAFDALATGREVDPDRPALEFYRSRRELVLYLPVR